jgi:hypothetical protein
MTRDEPLTLSMAFPAFAIDFIVEEQESIERTADGHPDAEDFAFAVGDTWLRIGSVRYLVISEFQTGNLIETLKSLRKTFSDSTPTLNLERSIPRGGLCAWMRGYWHRLEHDCLASDDEAVYDLLFPLCVMAERNGCIAVYRYEGIPTIEIATHSEPASQAIAAWCEFDPDDATHQVDELLRVVRARLKRPQKRG